MVEAPQESKHHELPTGNTKQEKSDKFWKITTVVLIVLLGFFLLRGGGNSGNSPTGGGVALGDTNPSPAPTVNIDMEELVDDDPFLGEEDAPVTIVEFSDYECPFCSRFYTQTLPLIKSQYIDTGKVKFVYRDFPLSFHPQAMPSALAANCAGEQGKYYEYHNKIFENQALLSDATRKQWAQELGLDIPKWESCLSDPAQRQEIQKDLQDGSAAGITGTPGFIINGQLVSGAQPFSVFQQVIDATLQN